MMKWTRGAGELAGRFDLVTLFLSCLFLVYTFAYLSYGALPGNSPHPEDWWGWWDQSNYLKSARAFSIGSLDPLEHWYPPGYALLAAPFQRFSRVHAFFFLDAACLLTVAYCFVLICGRFDVGRLSAVIIFTLSTVLNRIIFEQYVVPWSTSPTSALFYIILVLFLAEMPSIRVWALIGFLSGLTVLFRPTDIVALLPIHAYLVFEAVGSLVHGQASVSRAIKKIGITIAAGATGLSVYLGFYLAIYGFQVSEYLKVGQNVGFLLSSIPFKLYVTFIEPISTYGDGQGILRRYPWMFLSVIGILVYSARNAKYLVVSSCIVIHILFYVSYVDFIPTGIWRYFNIHYFKWTFPLLGMFAWISVRDLALTRSYRLYGILSLGLLIALSIRLSPVTIAATSAVITEGNRFDVGFNSPVMIRALDFPKASGSFNELLFNMHEVSADGKSLVPISDFRALPMPFGVRLIFNRPLSASWLSGAFKGEISLNAAAPPPVGRQFAVSWGIPCWIAKRACPISATLP